MTDVTRLGLERIDLAVLPTRAESATTARAVDALTRAASRRVATPSDADMLERALRALDLTGSRRQRRLMRASCTDEGRDRPAPSDWLHERDAGPVRARGGAPLRSV